MNDSPPVSLSTIIRILWKDISTPFKYVEFDGSLYLSVALLVVELQGKTFLTFGLLKLFEKF